MKTIQTFFILICFCSQPAFCAQYYVSVDGNDQQKGSREMPLATIQVAIDIAQAGDSVIIREGAYRLTQPIFIRNRGVENQWLTIKSAENERVTINGNHIHFLENGDTISRTKTGLIHIENSSFIRLENLKVLYSRSIGILVLGEGTNNIELINCSADQTFGSGIALWNAKDIRVRNCTVSRANNVDMRAVGVMVRHETPHEAISIASVSNFEVSGCQVYSCYKEGIDCKEVSNTGKIFNNHVHHCDRQGIYIDSWFGLLHNIQVYNNTVHHCEYGIAISSEGEGSAMENVEVYGNTIHHNRASGIIFGVWGYDGPRSKIKIYSNKIINNGGPAHWSGLTGGIDLRSASLSEIEIYANICSGNWSFGVATLYPKDEILQLEKKSINIFSNLIDKKVIRPYEKGEYAVVYPYTSETTVFGDPVFKDEKNYDFTLGADSPAIFMEKKAMKIEKMRKTGVTPEDKKIDKNIHKVRIDR